MAKKDAAADKAADGMTEGVARPDTLKVSLDRSFMWVADDGTEKTYGPGNTEIPYPMAEGLVRAGRLDPSVLPVPLGAAVAVPATPTTTVDNDVKTALAEVKAELEALREAVEAALAGLSAPAEDKGDGTGSG